MPGADRPRDQVPVVDGPGPSQERHTQQALVRTHARQ